MTTKQLQQKLKNVALVWFRNDLRLLDNEILHEAVKSQKEVLPFFCFDERLFERSRIGKFVKTGPYRAKFLIESVQDLRNNLQQEYSSNLMIRFGKPEVIIPQICREYNVDIIYTSKEICSEETNVEISLKKALQRDLKVHFIWNQSLLHLNDLPFEVSKLPDVFTQFRVQVESKWIVRSIIPKPKSLKTIEQENIDWGMMPKLIDLYRRNEQIFSQLQQDYPHLLNSTKDNLIESLYDKNSVLQFEGGETKALARVHDYIHTKQLIKTYKETRNGLVGGDYSSKFSAWLWNGCVSAKYIYHQIKKYEQQVIKNDSTYWLVFELLWRDYFKFLGLKYGDQLFYLYGIKKFDYRAEFGSSWLKKDVATFAKWRDGLTGYPFVDANMIELKRSGWMSNRGRQNVASFLVKDLHVDWRLGAEWFESALVDFDVTSNWGNWLYASGVGTDPRGQSRYFNVLKQANDYDPNGDFVKLWIPALRNISKRSVHQPYTLNKEEQAFYKISLPQDYPAPIVHVRKAPSMEKNESKNGGGSQKNRWDFKAKKI